jgi:hypothetical protein
MPTPPSVDDVTAYLAELGLSDRWAAEQIADALATEEAAQANTCRILPVDIDGEAVEPYAADLAGALKRRVAAHLALRILPLGVSATIAGDNVATNRVGGLDAEVGRLEGPYRKMPVG